MSDNAWIVYYTVFMTIGAITVVTMRFPLVQQALQWSSTAFEAPAALATRAQDHLLWILLAYTLFFICGLFIPAIRVLL